MAAEHRAVADCLEEAGDACSPSPAAAEPMAHRPVNETDRAAARGVQAKDEDADRAAVAETATMRFWALLASAQINMRKVEAGRPRPSSSISRVTSQPESVTSCPRSGTPSSNHDSRGYHTRPRTFKEVVAAQDRTEMVNAPIQR